ncbi:short-chain dehydrogenase/reductase [Rhizoctonia solani AG-3 Rhs1AP]|uniref:Short-chain dehydrogenase/reductase n=1 Tax=Rhizoctonia solani AG-3 Rhs1AP TaxID=1086054 RepID=X8IXH5_9AGAM|nr:short-chain dehydrogenase/reductase [Rhizoctonia solani AG-3 Rhs1AP]
MPYSQHAHTTLVGSLLATLSFTRINLDNLLVPLYPTMKMPFADLSGKLVVVTGANSGIGLEAARAFAGMGAHVVLACRNEARGEEAKSSIIKSTGNLKIEVELLDCGKFASVRAFLDRWKERESRKIDVLVNNAGGLTSTVSLTPDGFEQTYQANHLSHVLLTHGLLNLGCIAPDARIISISSAGSYSSDPLNKQNAGSRDILDKFNNQVGVKLALGDMMQLYSRSKVSQVVWSMALQRRLSEVDAWKGITVHSCHPGTVKSSIWTQPDGAGSMSGVGSDLFKWMARTFGISSEEGAATAVWLAVSPEPASSKLKGRFWDRMKWKWVQPWVLDIGLQDELWDLWCNETEAPLR